MIIILALVFHAISYSSNFEQDFLSYDNEAPNNIIQFDTLSNKLLDQNITNIGYDKIKTQKKYKTKYSLIEKKIEQLDDTINFPSDNNQDIDEHQISVLNNEIMKYDNYDFYAVLNNLLLIAKDTVNEQQIDSIKRIINLPVSNSVDHFLTMAHKKYLFGLFCSAILSPITKIKQFTNINEDDLNCTNRGGEHGILFHYFGYFSEMNLDIKKGLNFLHKTKSFIFLHHMKVVLFIGDDALFSYKAILKSLENKIIIFPVFTQNFVTHVTFETPLENFIHDYQHVRDMLNLELLDDVYPENNLSYIKNENSIINTLNIISKFCFFINNIEKNIKTNKNAFNYVFSTLVRDFRPREHLNYLNNNTDDIYMFYKAQMKYHLFLIKTNFEKSFYKDKINLFYNEYKELGETIKEYFPEHAELLTSTNLTFKDIGFSVDSDDKLYNAPLAFHLFGILLKWALEEIDRIEQTSL